MIFTIIPWVSVKYKSNNNNKEASGPDMLTHIFNPSLTKQRQFSEVSLVYIVSGQLELQRSCLRKSVQEGRRRTREKWTTWCEAWYWHAEISHPFPVTFSSVDEILCFAYFNAVTNHVQTKCNANCSEEDLPRPLEGSAASIMLTFKNVYMPEGELKWYECTQFVSSPTLFSIIILW